MEKLCVSGNFSFPELNKAYKLVNDEKEVVKVKEMINEGRALADQKVWIILSYQATSLI